jgi:hypothetical protein
MVKFLDQRKHAKMQRLQDPNQSTVDNLNNVGREASRYFMNKMKEYQKVKLRNLKQTVRSKISKTCTGTTMTLRRVTSLNLI